MRGIVASFALLVHGGALSVAKGVSTEGNLTVASGSAPAFQVIAASGDTLWLIVEPAKCLACEFVFRSREKLTTPGSCPKCRSERVAPPAFRVAAKG